MDENQQLNFMSHWLRITGYMVLTDYLPCNIGKHAGDEKWEGKISEESVPTMIGKLITSARDTWYQEHQKYLPYWIRIVWTNVKTGETDEEYYHPEEDEYRAAGFLHGSEGPLDISSVMHTTDIGVSYHIVFDGALRDRHNLESVKEWWKTMQRFFDIGAGFIRAHSFEGEWSDIIKNFNED